MLAISNMHAVKWIAEWKNEKKLFRGDRADREEDRSPDIDLLVVVSDEPHCIIVNPEIDIAGEFGHLYLDTRSGSAPGSLLNPCSSHR